MNQYKAHKVAVELADRLKSITEWEDLRATLKQALQEIDNLSIQAKPVRVYSVAPIATQRSVEPIHHSLLAKLRFNLAIVAVFFLDVLRNPTSSSRISADIDTGVIRVEQT